MLVICLIVKLLWMFVQINGDARIDKKFPEDFLFGASTSAYQIEGGWNADGKGVSMWDYYLHNKPDIVEDHTNGDIAADSYHLYKKDIEILKHLGVKSYRFSLSWTRILPGGTTDHINPLGIAYYKKLIDLLLANNIIPLVTLYHWDLPIVFSDQGAWLNESTADRFGEYARVVFKEFGDKVKHWITVNEPSIHCSFIYELGFHPPFTKSSGIGFYECGRNLLLAHARAYHIYDKEFRKGQGGKVGISLDMEWPIPASDSLDDVEAAEDYLAFQIGQYMDPIFKGGYPQRLLDRVSAASTRQGFTESRLRPLTKGQKAHINGTADFVGINHYYSLYLYRNESVRGMYEEPSFKDDQGFGTFQDESWPRSAFIRFREYAPGLSSLLMYLRDNYNNPLVYITESGFPLTSSEDLHDDKKARYLKKYLEALLDAIRDGCNCRGYFVWSLMDGLEWASGLNYRYGLYQVDFNDSNRTRTPRMSALVYKEIIRTRTIDMDYSPDPYDTYEAKCYD